MNPFGDGSDGALNVTSGTHNLLLNKEYQFTTVNVGSGATLSTNSTTGAVLFIKATQSITIDGAINVSNKLINGQNNWPFTIDGRTFITPLVANGGEGSAYNGQTVATSANGFGGGGGGMSLLLAPGGNGGVGSPNPGNGGESVTATAHTNQEIAIAGKSGQGSAGGSGMAYATFKVSSGDKQGTSYSGLSGAGGRAYGSNGADGSDGYLTTSGTGSSSYSFYSGGGGGAGGNAGKAGVHVILQAPTIILNGQIITSGTNGGNGGNGGRSRINLRSNEAYGMGGGGGAGGSAGNIQLAYSKTLVDNSTKIQSGGVGGVGGKGYNDLTQTAQSGGSGTNGQFIAQYIKPVANFSANATTGMNDFVVNFTNLSQGGDSFLWDFGNGHTSTEFNPSVTYTELGTYTVSLTSTNDVGSHTETKTNYITVNKRIYKLALISRATGGGTGTPTLEKSYIDITSKASGGGSIYIRTVFQALPQKDYEYRVYDEDWNYMSTWQNMPNEFSYTQKINENAGPINVTLSRSPDNRIVMYETLKDTDGSVITDENSDTILLQTETANSVGEGTDVRENLNVEVWTFYGGYDTLTDENGEDILDHQYDPILTQLGAPNGKRVYSGYIVDYELVYGETTGVNVVIAPQATEMSHYVFKNALGDTTVKYLNTDPIKMARDAMDNYISQGGYITYDIATMPLSGSSVDYDFKLQTTRETVDKSIDLLPSGYYHFVDPGENKQYMLQRKETPDHVFYYEKEISDMRLRKSITQLVNKVYFVGGELVDGTDLFKYYEDTTSVSTLRPGLDRISDSRVTLDEPASILSNRVIAEFKNARWRTTVTITDAVYDIENIKLGQMVGFKNFGTTTDSLVLQIVGLQRTTHTVTLELDMSLPNEAKRLEELKKQILNEQIRDIGDSPS